MLEVFIPPVEGYNDEKNEFFTICNGGVLQLEHSLLSIHKWEQKYHRAFLDNGATPKSEEETKFYVKCMTINKNVDPEIYNHLPSKCMLEIKQYIEDPMTATTIYEAKDDNDQGGKVKVHTAESLYADMIQLNIPVEFNKWHLNSLLTLIRLCALRQNPPKKMSPQETAAHYAKLNKARRAAKAKKH